MDFCWSSSYKLQCVNNLYAISFNQFLYNRIAVNQVDYRYRVRKTITVLIIHYGNVNNYWGNSVPIIANFTTPHAFQSDVNIELSTQDQISCYYV